MEFQQVADFIDDSLAGRIEGDLRSLFGTPGGLRTELGLGVASSDEPGGYQLVVFLRTRDAASQYEVSLLQEKLQSPVRTMVIGQVVAESGRVAQPGDGIAVVGTNSYGTLGGFVTLLNGEPALLTNAHVLAGGGLGMFAGVVRLHVDDPADPDLATVATVLPLLPGTPNPIDAAVARMLNPDRISTTPRGGAGPIRGVAAPAVRPGDHVCKTGARTGHTTGTVLATKATISVDYGVGDVRLSNLIVTEGDQGRFTRPGDSGSLVRDVTGTLAVALHAAGSPELASGPALSWSQPIGPVLDALSVTLMI